MQSQDKTLRAGVITLFPEMFDAISDYGISGRALKEGLVELGLWNPRYFTEDKHQTVDDRPYGGGPGMLMKTGPLALAINAARQELPGAKVIYLTPQGSPVNQQTVNQLANQESLIFLCGRYEGIDERIIETEVDDELSLGDFVLSGGEVAAMALLDAIIRLQPGVLGHEDSAEQDSFMNGLLDCPHYTRPEEYEGKTVPPVLLSGDHEAIRKWRMQQSLGRTWQRRPDLLEEMELTDEQKALLALFISDQESGSDK
ncbi:MAG: tRNA (guanosine(37)-N1)-methyltransferase TrmD [Gammaproteobacteria bacterium]|nr:tRNA (guanosine(37)-N1)-methyltransferase TrmD [Gammaproteobacteria bacterium]